GFAAFGSRKHAVSDRRERELAVERERAVVVDAIADRAVGLEERADGVILLLRMEYEHRRELPCDRQLLGGRQRRRRARGGGNAQGQSGKYECSENAQCEDCSKPGTSVEQPIACRSW